MVTTAKRWHLKSCPKCSGDQQDNDEGDRECLQCGHVLYNEDVSAYRTPVPESLISSPITQARGPGHSWGLARHTKGAGFANNPAHEVPENPAPNEEDSENDENADASN